MTQVASTDATQISVSIVLLTKNGERYIGEILDQIFAQDYRGSVEVIVIDSGSSDATVRIVTKYPAVRLIEIPPQEFGHGKTRNLGASLARGPLLVFLPQDATPVGPNWLASLLTPFSDPAIAGVYARQVARPDTNPMEAFFLAETYGESPAIRRLRPEEPPSLASCFFSTVSGAIRASVWKEHPFREDIIMSEDQAWSFDAMRAGHAIAYQPEATVLHSHDYGVVNIFKRNFDSGYAIWQIFSGRTGLSPSVAAINLFREFYYIAKVRRLSAWHRFIPYEVARHLGFAMGLHGNKLPTAIRKRLSHLKYFWE